MQVWGVFQDRSPWLQLS